MKPHSLRFVTNIQVWYLHENSLVYYIYQTWGRMQIIGNQFGNHLGNYLCHSCVIRIIVLDVWMRINKQESKTNCTNMLSEKFISPIWSQLLWTVTGFCCTVSTKSFWHSVPMNCVWLARCSSQVPGCAKSHWMIHVPASSERHMGVQPADVYPAESWSAAVLGRIKEKEQQPNL